MQNLCVCCRDIPLDPIILGQDALHNTWFDLGDLDRVINSKCPFCQLVARAIHQDHIATANDGVATSRLNPVNVVWSKNIGPEGGGAFYVYGIRRCVICFTGDPEELKIIDKPRFLRSTVEPSIDYVRIKQWVRTCETNHTEGCGTKNVTFSKAYPGLLVLRLIDIKQCRLVEVRNAPPYISLSYVWGGARSIRLTKSILKRMLLPHGLRAAWSSLPQTIIDTFELARKLGVNHVWIDALCLVQDDPGDLRRGIDTMDNIYERSWLTVVAACGRNANSGLPGVRKNSRTLKESVEVKPGVQMMITLDLDRMLQFTIYHTRGWTFQEHALSRRALYFFEDEVFFRCRRLDISERCIGDEHHPIVNIENGEWYQPRELKQILRLADPLRDYSRLLEVYTARVFTNPQDAIWALAGTIRRVGENLGQDMVQGMPAGALGHFLLFRSASGGGFLRRRRGFPSWSWAGWDEQITFEYDNLFNNWKDTRHWILWFKRTAPEVVDLLPNCYDAGGQYTLTTAQSNSAYQGRFCSRYNLDVSKTNPTHDLSLSSGPISYPILQFWTLAVYFRISIQDALGGIGSFFGEDGRSYGSFRVDDLESVAFNESNDPVEIILLSEHTEEDSSDGLAIFYNVMLLDRSKEVAERKGLGHLSLSHIDHSYSPGPIWKEILLG